MKKLKMFLVGIFCFISFIPGILASSVNIGVSSTSQVVVGNKVTVTVTISSNTGIGSWQMNLNYDKSYLQLTSSNAEGGGNMMAGYATADAGVKKKTYTFTFKTLKTGSTKLSITSALVYAADMSQMQISSGSKTIKIITQEELEASYSKDNSLKALSVEGYEISPEFNKDTLAYSVNVPENTSSINIVATKNDSTATVSGDGEKEVTSGTNTFEIVVRAQNGAERTYTLTVDVVDQNPINVVVNNNNYTVVKIRDYLTEPPFYNEYSVNISEFDIPAYKNDNTGIVLVGLKDDAGNISLFRYDESTGEFQTYLEVGVNKLTIVPKNTDKVIEDYNKGKVKIDDTEVDCFYYNEESDFVVIYGVNVETGEEGFYVYDKVNQNIMRYNDEEVIDLKEKMQLYTYIIIGFSGLLILMFIILIMTVTKKKKKNVKKKEEIKEEIKEDRKEDNNEIVELTNDDKKIDLSKYDNNKKKKKKKKNAT